MRPRVFPAEDRRFQVGRPRSERRFNEAAGIPRGRRPDRRGEDRHLRRASMRPRVFPAEDPAGWQLTRPEATASMRPRVFPAEDLAVADLCLCHLTSFNEAAGIPRGRLVPDGQVTLIKSASMRPRVFPAEDPARAGAASTDRSSFNEAAGIPRGRLGHVRDAVDVAAASMRPRVFPAEDGSTTRRSTCRWWTLQ